MFVIKLAKAIVIEGAPVAVIGPFRTIHAAMVWGTANLPADCQAEIDSIHVPEDWI